MVTLVVEDGSGLENANTYISLEDADTYFDNRNNQVWSAFEDATKSQALFDAAIALDALYFDRYLSHRIFNNDQALEWPRQTFWALNYRRYDQGTIPKPLKDAQCEIALKALQGLEIYPEERTDIHVTSESVKVGEISTSKSYKRPAGDVAKFEDWRKIELILKPIIKPRSGKQIRFSL